MSTEQRETLDAILRQSAFPADSRCQRATATAPRAAIGAAAARRRDRDRGRAGRRPHRRDHRRRNRTSPRCPLLPRRRVRDGGRLPSPLTWPRRSAGGRTPRSSPSTTGSPPSTRIRRRLTTLSRPMKPSCTPASPLRTSSSRESPPAAAWPSPPWSTPAITGCPCPPRRSSCRRMPISPWPGRRMETRRDVDPLLSREALQARVPDYTSGHDAALGLISPDIRRPVRPAAPDHPGRKSRGSPRRRRPPRATSRHRRRRGHARHHPWGAPRLPGLSRRSLTKRPRRWTEPDSSSRRISPAQNASPHSERRGPLMSKAVRFDDYGGVEVLEVRDVARPEPGPDQVLVAVRAAGINPSEGEDPCGPGPRDLPRDLSQRRGLRPRRRGRGGRRGREGRRRGRRGDRLSPTTAPATPSTCSSRRPT